MFIWYVIIRNHLKAPNVLWWWHFDVHDLVISLKVDLLVFSFSRGLIKRSIDIGHECIVNIKFCIWVKADMLISSVPASKWLQLVTPEKKCCLYSTFLRKTNKRDCV